MAVKEKDLHLFFTSKVKAGAAIIRLHSWTSTVATSAKGLELCAANSGLCQRMHVATTSLQAHCGVQSGRCQ